MGRLYKQYIDAALIYTCADCKTHFASFDEIMSKAFRGRTGKAYLFNEVVNVTPGPLEDRKLTTGLHTVADVYCNCCNALVGWKYETAYEESQRYKEGKFIMEKAKMIRVSEVEDAF
eukprot:GFYU01002254.1.p1 GENE.GFYU01002254.1~~GFYU01002254.1.p1  ORF type:complete len:117 (-),score=28.21 GFYU01002254.1:478-828(-)